MYVCVLLAKFIFKTIESFYIRIEFGYIWGEGTTAMISKKFVCLLLIILLPAMFLSITPAYAANISTVPTHGEPGITLTISGNSFPSGEQIQILFDGTVFNTTTTDNKGIIHTQITVPSPCASGSHEIIAIQVANNDNNATVYFTVNPMPNLTVGSSPETIHGNGQQYWVTISGNLSCGGLGLSGKEINLTYYDPSIGSFIQLGTAITDGAGVYSFSWNTPATLTDGFYAVKAAFAGDNDYLATEAETINVTGGGGLFVAPEYLFGALAAIVACFAALLVFKVRKNTLCPANSSL